MILDLSHRLEPGMPSYPGLPVPKFHTFLPRADAVRQSYYEPGTTFEIASYELGGNTGTYVDAPFHRYENGADLADVPLNRLANLPGLVVTAPADGPIGVDAFQKNDLRGKAVLVFTKWATRWGSDGYFRSGPYLRADTCEFLVKEGSALVGIDCANIDNMEDRSRPAHTILLAAGIPVVEHLRGLDQIGDRSFRFFAVPPAIRGGTSFPVRAIALCE